MKRVSIRLVWVVTILLSLFFAAQGASKLFGPSAAHWGARFVHWGYPAGFHRIVGGMELACAVALLFPRSRKTAAAFLIAIMLGALLTHLVHGEILRMIPPLVLGSISWFLFRIHLRSGDRKDKLAAIRGGSQNKESSKSADGPDF